MRLSELTIIYFATAAPFGVASFLRQPARDARRLRALSRATGAALLWPMTALLLLLERNGSTAGAFKEGAGGQDGAPDERRIEQAKRDLTNALREVEDVLDESGVGDVDGVSDGVRVDGREARRFAMFAARESAERYVGLALACAGANRDANPSERELELCRLAGGSGDDLLLSGRCIHRRNVTRLFAHRDRARAEMIHALAGVREETGRLQKGTTRGEAAAAARRASEALLRALARAVEMLSLLEDEEAARRVARLLDAECARLRRLEAAAEEESEDARKGAQVCTTRAAHRAFATPLLRTTASRRG